MFISSCAQDDEVGLQDAVVGKWELITFQLSEIPKGFHSWENVHVEIDRLEEDWESYMIEFTSNHTYERTISLKIGDSTIDDGTWGRDGNKLILVPNKALQSNDEFNIEENSSRELVLSEPVQISLIEDAIRDTLTVEYAGSLSKEEFNALFTEISIKLNYVFNKEVE